MRKEYFGPCHMVQRRESYTHHLLSKSWKNQHVGYLVFVQQRQVFSTQVSCQI